MGRGDNLKTENSRKIERFLASGIPAARLTGERSFAQWTSDE